MLAFRTKWLIKNAAGVANGTDTGSSDPTNVGYQTNGWYKLSTHPLYFTRAGNLWSAGYDNTTTGLYYWSATSYSGSSAYHLGAGSGGLYPAGRNTRDTGFSVRCVVGYVPIYYLRNSELVGNYFVLANGTDTGSGGVINVGYQTNGWHKLSTHPLYFTRAGFLWSDEYRDTTTYLYYWSATSRSSSNAYFLFAYSGELYSAHYYNRASGFSVRCVVGYVLVCHLLILRRRIISSSLPPA